MISFQRSPGGAFIRSPGGARNNYGWNIDLPILPAEAFWAGFTNIPIYAHEKFYVMVATPDTNSAAPEGTWRRRTPYFAAEKVSLRKISFTYNSKDFEVEFPPYFTVVENGQTVYDSNSLGSINDVPIEDTFGGGLKSQWRPDLNMPWENVYGHISIDYKRTCRWIDPSDGQRYWFNIVAVARASTNMSIQLSGYSTGTVDRTLTYTDCEGNPPFNCFDDNLPYVFGHVTDVNPNGTFSNINIRYSQPLHNEYIFYYQVRDDFFNTNQYEIEDKQTSSYFRHLYFFKEKTCHKYGVPNPVSGYVAPLNQLNFHGYRMFLNSISEEWWFSEAGETYFSAEKNTPDYWPGSITYDRHLGGGSLETRASIPPLLTYNLYQHTFRNRSVRGIDAIRSNVCSRGILDYAIMVNTEYPPYTLTLNDANYQILCDNPGPTPHIQDGGTITVTIGGLTEIPLIASPTKSGINSNNGRPNHIEHVDVEDVIAEINTALEQL